MEKNHNQENAKGKLVQYIYISDRIDFEAKNIFRDDKKLTTH